MKKKKPSSLKKKQKTKPRAALLDFRLPFVQLGWTASGEGSSTAIPDGWVGFLVVAPWCEDCVRFAPKAARFLAAQTGKSKPAERAFVVGEFSEPGAVKEFARDHGWSAPLLFGTREKTLSARNLSYFRLIRAAVGDTRRWGLPTWIEGEIRHGELRVRSVRIDL